MDEYGDASLGCPHPHGVIQGHKEAHLWARRAHRHAIWALWSSGVGILLAIIALLTS